MNENHREIKYLFERYKKDYEPIATATKDLTPMFDGTNARDIYAEFLAIRHILHLLQKNNNDPEDIYGKLLNNFNKNTMNDINGILDNVDTSPDDATAIDELKQRIENLQGYKIDNLPNETMSNILNKESEPMLKHMLNEAITIATNRFNVLLKADTQQHIKPR